MELERRSKLATKLELAPLVDVVFLLLIFFLLTSVYVVPQSVEVNLPVSANAKSPLRATITVSLATDRSITVEGKRVDWSALRARVESILQPNSKQTIALHASADVSVQDLLAVMDVLRAAGGRNIALAARPEA